MSNPLIHPPATLFKRLLAIVYDLLLLIAIAFTLGVIMSILTTFILNNGNAITEAHPYYLLNQFLILLTIFIAGLIFYGWFWTHGGQTLGMKTWRLQLIAINSDKVSWEMAIKRYFAALVSWSAFGLGFIWSIFDNKKRCWHDILSASQLIQLDKK